MVLCIYVETEGKGLGIVCIVCIFLMYFAVFFSRFFFFVCCFVLRCVCVCVRILYKLVLYATLLSFQVCYLTMGGFYIASNSNKSNKHRISTWNMW